MKFINYLVIITVLSGSLFFVSCDEDKNDEKIMKAELIPLEDFFKNPEKTSYQISPDGKYYSYLAPYEKRMNIHVQERGKDSVIRLTSETDRNIAG